MPKEQHADPMAPCGHTVRDRLNVFEKGDCSTCILCLHEQIKAKNTAMQEALSYESTGVDYWRKPLEKALKGSE